MVAGEHCGHTRARWFWSWSGTYLKHGQQLRDPFRGLGCLGCLDAFPHMVEKNIHSLFGSIQFQENMTWANGSKSPRRLGCLWINFHCNMLDFENAAGCILNFNLLEHSIPKYKWTNFVGRQMPRSKCCKKNTSTPYCDFAILVARLENDTGRQGFGISVENSFLPLKKTMKNGILWLTSIFVHRGRIGCIIPVLRGWCLPSLGGRRSLGIPVLVDLQLRVFKSS